MDEKNTLTKRIKKPSRESISGPCVSGENATTQRTAHTSTKTSTIHVVHGSAVVWLVLGMILGQLAGGPWLEELATYLRGYRWDYRDRCILETKETGYGLDFCRLPVDCQVCQTVHTVEEIHVRDLSLETFEKRYARNSRPLVVRNASLHWKAMKELDYDWLKREYLSSPDNLDYKSEECWFNNYRTHELRTLSSVFRCSFAGAGTDTALPRLPGSRVAGESMEPWYVGWSVCQPEVAQRLHQLYTRPDFIDPYSTPPKKPWIFIGTPGPGAPFHIDNVQQSSWQAQIRGSKKWFLKPPPECRWTCGQQQLEVTVHPGDIIVVDTNVWFHSTQVLPGPLSVVFTNEFD